MPDPASEQRISFSECRWLLWAYAAGLPIFMLVATGSWGMALIGFLTGALAGGLNYLYLSSFPEVLLTADALILRDEAGDRKIPFTSIRNVRESRWSRVKRITIDFQNSAGRIECFDFIPAAPSSLPMNHPIARDLRRLAKLSK